MLLSWRVSNFKSIREPVELSLKPLTVVCGPNSSGKSTLLKSILVVAQSLGSTAWEEPLVLNGRFLQLGYLEDVFHHGSERTDIELGFSVQPLQGTKIEVQACIEAFRPKDESTDSRMRARTQSCRVRVGRRGEIDTSLELVHHPIQQDASREEISGAPETLQRHLRAGLFGYEIVAPKRAELGRPQMLEEAISGSMTNFIPGRVLMRVRPRVRDVTRQIEYIVYEVFPTLGTRRSLSRSIDPNQRLDPYVRGALGLVWERRKSSGRSNDIFADAVKQIMATEETTLGDCKSLLDRLSPSDIPDLTRRLNGVIPEVQRRIIAKEGRDQTALEVQPFPTQYDLILDDLRQILGRRVQYLGPLREDPRAIYAIPLRPNQRDVGLKGEYTAAMLDRYGNEEIEYPMPPDSGSNSVRRAQGTLAEAVRSWLEYAGMAEAVSTNEAVRIGYYLNVRPPGLERELDLTSVGVGVSQLLPTLVMALLAPAGTIMLIEQPEVHLHPKVQSALGDFFMGIAACRKQCIIETHSEHLIDRLRLRIAQDSTDQTQGNIRIYFVERERAVSRFRLVEPNEYGAITEWPRGFFDEAEEEASRLARAALAKSRQASQTRDTDSTRRSKV